MRNRLKSLDGKNTLTVLLVLATLAIVAAGFFAQAIQYNELFGLYERQSEQLKANGIKPTTPSPEQIAKQGPAGDQGLSGDTGPTGPRGVAGEPGIPGISGLDGAVGATGESGGSGGPGSAGAPGVTGPAGKDGANGAAGADGAPGAPGATGADGTPVLSWTYVTANGVQKQCVRDVPFDAKAPTYNCQNVTPTPATTP